MKTRKCAAVNVPAAWICSAAELAALMTVSLVDSRMPLASVWELSEVPRALSPRDWLVDLLESVTMYVNISVSSVSVK